MAVNCSSFARSSQLCSQSHRGNLQRQDRPGWRPLFHSYERTPLPAASPNKRGRGRGWGRGRPARVPLRDGRPAPRPLQQRPAALPAEAARRRPRPRPRPAEGPGRPHLHGARPPPLPVLGARLADPQLRVVLAGIAQPAAAAAAGRHLPITHHAQRRQP